MTAPARNGTRPAASRVLAVLKYALAVALLGWLLGSGRLRLDALLDRPPSFAYLIFFALVLVALLAQATRWWYLLRAHGVPVGLPRTIRLAWIGNFFALFSPGGAGGEIARGYYLWREHPERRVPAVLSVMADRLLGLYTLLALGTASFGYLLVTGPVPAALRLLGLIAATLFVGATATVALAAVPGVRGRLRRLLPARLGEPFGSLARAYRRRPGAVVAALALSLLSSLTTSVAFVAAAEILEVPIGLGTALVDVPFVMMANSLPISPAGLGVGEYAAFLVFRNSATDAGAEVMLLYRLGVSLVRLPGVVAFLSHRQDGRPLPGSSS